jgi:HD superfamily phosphohydrolase
VPDEDNQSRGERLLQELTVWVDETLEPYRSTYTRPIGGPKIVQDGLWGTAHLEPFELHILDCPLLQRLRFVSQTGLAHYIYPAANHTRFQHTLGMTIVIRRVLGLMKWRRGGGVNPLDGLTLDDAVERNLKVAALLHDVGHGVFSHASEQFVKDDVGIKDAKEILGISSKAQPHEIMSFAIVVSEPFREFIRALEELYPEAAGVDLDWVAHAIVGDSSDAIAELINGTLDADKLDYMSRDSYASGIKMSIDADRIATSLFYVPPEDSPDGKPHLGVGVNGIAAMEQLVFNRTTLTTALYHHQKDRAIEAGLHVLFRMIQKETEEHAATGIGSYGPVVYRNPLDMIRQEECAFLHCAGWGDASKEWARRLRERDLPLRAVVIRLSTCRIDRLMEDDSEVGLLREQYGDGVLEALNGTTASQHRVRILRSLFTGLARDAGRVVALAAQISERARDHLYECHPEVVEDLRERLMDEFVILDLPEVPVFAGRLDTPIGVGTPEHPWTKLRDLLDLTGWEVGYAAYQYTGHVFCAREVLDFCGAQNIYEWTNEVFSRELGIGLSKTAAYDKPRLV